MTHFWAEEKASRGDIKVTKVKSEDNLADALTKPVTKEIMSIHVRGAGGETSKDRSSIAPASGYMKVTGNDWVADQETQE